MKIKTTTKSYDEVCKIECPKHIKPVKQWSIIRKLLRFVAKGEMKKVGFTYKEIGMERLGKDEPCLILMNHSSFTDLFIIATLLLTDSIISYALMMDLWVRQNLCDV